MSIEVGLNLFSIHTELEKDFRGTLDKVAEAGYRNVELISLNRSTGKRYSDTISAAEMRRMLQDRGLRPIGAHESIAAGTEPKDQPWEAILEYNLESGCRNIVIPAIWFRTAEEASRVAEQLNAIGRTCEEAGARLYYHNHFHEFTSVGDTTLFQLLAEQTDPRHLKFELDVVWAMRGGQDPLALLNRLGSRCDMIHQKDVSLEAQPLNMFELLTPEDDSLEWLPIYKKYMKPHDFVDLGEGIFDFSDVYAQLKQLGTVRYAIVENEGKKPDRLASVAQDLNVIRDYV